MAIPLATLQAALDNELIEMGLENGELPAYLAIIALTVLVPSMLKFVINNNFGS